MRNHRYKQLQSAITIVCQRHGKVRGLCRLSHALGQDFGDAYKRLKTMEMRGEFKVIHNGPGRPMEIYMP